MSGTWLAGGNAAPGTLTIDGETSAADGNINSGKFSFSEHCR
jgi:hypothetical protein